MGLEKSQLRGDSRSGSGTVGFFCKGKIDISADDIGQPIWYSVDAGEKVRGFAQEIQEG